MEIRERITRKAAEMFIILGIKRVKMDTIAQKLNISKRTIYDNFRNKDALIRATIDLTQKELNDINNKIINNSENIIEAVLSLLQNGSELLAGINPQYYTDLKRLYPDIWKEKIEQSKEHSFKLILELLKKGKEQGIYRQEINEEIITLILTGQLYMLFEQKLFPAGKFSIVEVYENIIINMTRGVATNKGLELLEKHKNPSLPG